MPRSVPTYVGGLDELLTEGIPEGNVVLVTGTPGALKTSFVYSILYHNAREGRKGLFISLEQGYRELASSMARLGMDDLGDDRLLVVDVGRIRLELEEGEVKKDWMEILRRVILESVDTAGSSLLAIDSLDVLYGLGMLEHPRRELFHFFNFLRERRLTTFLISELPVGRQALSVHGEDFLADGVFLLKHFEVGETEVQLRLRCVKMRRTAHETGYYALGFGDGGLCVTRVIARKQGYDLSRGGS
ncbi:MAG: RAD55 family ATPase [Thermoplasmata archaeon]